MSRGLSSSQKVIMEKIQKVGHLNIYDVIDLVRNSKLDRDAIRSNLSSGIRDLVNISSLYRLMKSLVRRGLVAALRYVRPVVWYYVEWENGQPQINYEIGRAATMLGQKGFVQFETKGRVWEYC